MCVCGGGGRLQIKGFFVNFVCLTYFYPFQLSRSIGTICSLRVCHILVILSYLHFVVIIVLVVVVCGWWFLVYDSCSGDHTLCPNKTNNGQVSCVF